MSEILSKHNVWRNAVRIFSKMTFFYLNIALKTVPKPWHFVMYLRVKFPEESKHEFMAKINGNRQQNEVFGIFPKTLCYMSVFRGICSISPNIWRKDDTIYFNKITQKYCFPNLPIYCFVYCQNPRYMRWYSKIDLAQGRQKSRILPKNFKFLNIFLSNPGVYNQNIAFFRCKSDARITRFWQKIIKNCSLLIVPKKWLKYYFHPIFIQNFHINTRNIWHFYYL